MSLLSRFRAWLHRNDLVRSFRTATTPAVCDLVSAHARMFAHRSMTWARTGGDKRQVEFIAVNASPSLPEAFLFVLEREIAAAFRKIEIRLAAGPNDRMGKFSVSEFVMCLGGAGVIGHVDWCPVEPREAVAK